eukprot:188644-Rhodomonas_salina.1
MLSPSADVIYNVHCNVCSNVNHPPLTCVLTCNFRVRKGCQRVVPSPVTHSVHSPSPFEPITCESDR